MNKISKKIIAFALVVTLVFGILPTGILKAEVINTDAKISGGNFDAWSEKAEYNDLAKGLWIGHNGVYAERLSVEAVDSFEGQSAFAHVTINHKFDGSGKAVKEPLNTNVAMSGKNFEVWSNGANYGVSVSSDPNARLFVEDMASYNGENIVWHTAINHKAEAGVTTGDFRENSLDMFYNYKPELNLTSSLISRCIEEGYNTLRVKYYYSGNNDLYIRAGYEGQDDKWDFYLNETANKDTWSTFDISLEDVKVYVEKSYNTRNYLFRLQPTDSGTYNFYLGTAEVVKVTTEPETTTPEVTTKPVSPTDARLNGMAFQGWSDSTKLWIDSSLTYSERLAVEAVSEYEGQDAIYHATINHKADGSSELFKENSEDMFYTCYTALGVSKDDVLKWINDGYNKLRVNYYYKGDKDLKIYANYEGKVKNESWANYLDVNAQKNSWSSFDIDLSDIMYKFDDDAAVKEALKYLFKLSAAEQGTYEFYLGTAEAVKVTEAPTTEVPTTEVPTTTAKKEEVTTKKPVATPNKPVATTKKPVVTTKKQTVKKPIVSASKKKLSSKKVKLSIKKISGVSKYEAQISTTKSFKKVIVKKSSKSRTISLTSSKLKGKKKLYARVRAYKKIGKKTIKSSWSKVIQVKIKK